MSEADDPNWKIELVEPANMTWSKVKVKYTIDGVEATAADIKLDSTSTGTLPTVLATTDTVATTGAFMDDAIYDAANVTVLDGADTLVAKAAVGTIGTAAITSSTAKPTGTGYITYAFEVTEKAVTHAIKAATSAVVINTLPEYDATKWDTAAAAATLKVESDVASVLDGATAPLKLTLAGGTLTGIYGYKVTVTVGGKTYDPVVITSATSVALGRTDALTAELDLGTATFVVEQIDKFAPVEAGTGKVKVEENADATANTYTYTLYFNLDVANTLDISKISCDNATSTAVKDAYVNGDTVVVVLDHAVEDGKKIAFAASHGITQDGIAANALAAGGFTKAADGSWSFG